MLDSTFRVQELNPFQEWHLHGAVDDFDEALKMAGKICNQIGVSVRVLNRTDEVVASFESQASLRRGFSSTVPIFRKPKPTIWGCVFTSSSATVRLLELL